MYCVVLLYSSCRILSGYALHDCPREYVPAARSIDAMLWYIYDINRLSLFARSCKRHVFLVLQPNAISLHVDVIYSSVTIYISDSHDNSMATAVNASYRSMDKIDIAIVYGSDG
jgi:hypothetical protein